MFLNELPEECLLIIFGLINELDDLVSCYKVCSKWSRLIEERTRKVKYLLGDWPDEEPSPSYPLNHVYYRTEEPIDGTCLSTLFPNLIVAEFLGKLCKKVDHEDIVTLVKKIKSFKGIIDHFYNRDESVFQYCDDLEMVSTDCVWDIESFIKKKGAGIKQLQLRNSTLDSFINDVKYFPNLERLFICDYEEFPDGLEPDGAILSRLKIVELSLNNYCSHNHQGFKFMNSCRNLQSAHIRLECNHISVGGQLKHESLRDLVLECVSICFMYLLGCEYS
ncbi:uncharacterized protein LOC107371163 [Tetranychus urticae]|uniref:uncharacterized protein LOC107371163 n=1 Tax=Tetranychus urticae TaxID=32264 RepID=UPI000355AD52|nr:uncharacterized protein LOC107371163 [Tetranychus urticae]